MRYIYCLAAFALIGCGRPEQANQAVITVDAALAPYLARFTQDIGVSSDGISASLVDLNAATAGECIKQADGSKQIQINITWWSNADDDGKEQLMFHELGHCAMGLQHVADVDSNGCPISIMYPYVFGNTLCYTGNKHYYFRELASHD